MKSCYRKPLRAKVLSLDGKWLANKPNKNMICRKLNIQSLVRDCKV